MVYRYIILFNLDQYNHQVNISIKSLSIKNNIPLLRNKTLNLLKSIVIKYKYNSYLEIGTAYGYSANEIAKIDNIKKVVSLEKKNDNFNIALSFLKKNKKIKLINADAFEYQTKNKFDIILIDGPKSHQDILLDKYAKFLKKRGIIFIDNIFLKKFGNTKNKLTKNQRTLVDKVNKFRH
jgi:predicted O-methyltransferase YrrM